jgi:dipicolinate synthase subunit A
MFMDEYVIYAAGFTQAMSHCIQKLKQEGFTIVSEPNPQVTHLLLPVPSFTPDGMITGGGNLATLLTLLPKDIVVIGGNLDRPELDYYTTIDLLQDEAYLAENAQITAHCAIKLAMNQLPVILDDCPVLVLGWGRIGKCLARLLRQMGAKVTVCARKEADRSILRALGYGVTDYRQVNLNGYRVIFNTVPTMLFPVCPGNGLKIDLASRLGLGSEDVIWARGLPGKDAPESSGQLIAKTLLPILRKE